MTAGRHSKNYVDPELGLVRRCARCGESWPADREFFHVSGKGSLWLNSWCRACSLEYQKERRLRG